MASRNRLIHAVAGAAGLVAALTASTASADCALSIQPAQDQWVIPYDPFTADTAQRQFDVAMVNQGDTACVGSVRIDLRGEAYGLMKIGSPDRIAYALVDERGGVDVTPRSGLSVRKINARPINLAPGERTLMRFTFAASPEELLSSGLFSQDAFISVEQADGVSLGERPVTLGINIISAAVMGLKGEFARANGIARVNLGELVVGDVSLRTTLFVLSTSGYSVSVTSSNKGRLRLGASDWYVDYSLTMGDEALDLRQPDVITQPSRRWHHDDYPLGVSILDVQGKRAGEYSDVLTFTIAAL